MKKVPIRKPAAAADKVEIEIMLMTILTVFLKTLSYRVSQVATSKMMLATVKARKWIPLGLKVKLMAVAINPIKVTDPSFRIHHTATVNTVKPIRSQRKGSPNIWKKMGEKIEFNTPHSPAESAIAAKSILLKYGIFKPSV